MSFGANEHQPGRLSYHFPGYAAYIDRATSELGVGPEALHRGQWGIVSRISDLCSQASGRTHREARQIFEKAACLRDDLRVQSRLVDLMLQDLEVYTPLEAESAGASALVTERAELPAATERGRRSQSGGIPRKA